MNDVEFYTLQELILGLRKEYQKNENKLESLKALCFINQKEVADFRFELIKLSSREIKLCCIANKKRNCLEKLKIKLGFLKDEEERGEYLRTKSGANYFLNKKQTFPVVVSGINQDNFAVRASALITSSFAKNIQTKYINFFDQNYSLSLQLDHNQIDITIDDNTDSYNDQSSINIKYNAPIDEIEVVSKEKRIDTSLLENLLKIEISKNNLPEYHRQLLESGHRKNNKITVDEITKSKHSISLQIYEDTFQTLLIPTTLKRIEPQNRSTQKYQKYQKILKQIDY